VKSTRLSESFVMVGLDDEPGAITPAEEREREIIDLRRSIDGIEYRIFDLEQVPDRASTETRIAELLRERKATLARIRELGRLP
jgi:hypothetical protein